VQLIAASVIDIANEDNRGTVTQEILETALRRSVREGQDLFASLLYDRSELPGEWAYVFGFRAAAKQPPPRDERVRAALQARQIVTEANGDYCLSPPIALRWLTERGWFHA